MHSAPDIKKYIMIGAALLAFTAITVAANQLHLAIPLAITVALIIAITKGSMVASVFMHLSHEKKWIYGALIQTLAGFIIVMSLRAFHLFFIAMSVVLAAFVAAWAGQQFVADRAVASALTAVAALAAGA